MSKRQIINDRVATEAESEAGEVIFYIPDRRSEPYSFSHKLPLKAVVTKPYADDGFPTPGTVIIIVQAELVDSKDVVLGFVDGDDEGICMLEDVRIEDDVPVVQ